jgi:hypothetical protein
VKSLIKYSGVVTVFFVWITLGLAIVQVGLNNLTAISDLSIYPEAIPLFNFSLLISALFALIFFARYLGRKYQLNKYYRLSYTLAFVSQILLIPIPISVVHGLIYFIHWLLALVLFFATGAIMYTFAASLGNKVPGDIKSGVVVFVILLAFGIGMSSRILFGTVLAGQLIATLYTHYWIFRVTFLKRL